MALLSPGDTFPKLTITVPGGQTLTLPDALAGDFGVVLLTAGHGARTATRSCGPSSAPAALSPRLASA